VGVDRNNDENWGSDDKIDIHKLSYFTNYRELVSLVKQYYPTTRDIKLSWKWSFVYSIQFLFMMILFYYTYIDAPFQFNFMKIITQILYSFCESSIVMYKILHEGSHYSISVYPSLNTWLFKLGSAWILWTHNIWFTHHVFKHHSFTGGEGDPDIVLYNFHFYEWWDAVSFSFGGMIGKFDVVILYYAILPGQYVLQSIVYLFYMMNYLTCFDLDLSSLYSTLFYHLNGDRLGDAVDLFIITIKLYCFYRAGIILTGLHFVVMNFFYFINIIGDHDFFETKDNHYVGRDWAKRQISNSGNFLGNYGWWWTSLFGGINYQIEHHLFPNVNHIHLRNISLIVKEFCKKKGWKYVEQNTFLEMYLSTKKRILM
jgi:fatty acid desaturase